MCIYKEIYTYIICPPKIFLSGDGRRDDIDWHRTREPVTTSFFVRQRKHHRSANPTSEHGSGACANLCQDPWRKNRTK